MFKRKSKTTFCKIFHCTQYISWQISDIIRGFCCTVYHPCLHIKMILSKQLIKYTLKLVFMQYIFFAYFLNGYYQFFHYLCSVSISFPTYWKSFNCLFLFFIIYLSVPSFSLYLECLNESLFLTTYLPQRLPSVTGMLLAMVSVFLISAVSFSRVLLRGVSLVSVSGFVVLANWSVIYYFFPNAHVLACTSCLSSMSQYSYPNWWSLMICSVTSCRNLGRELGN
jgi:hypothetical protein